MISHPSSVDLIDTAHEATQWNDTVQIKAWKIIFPEMYVAKGKLWLFVSQFMEHNFI